MKNIEEMSDEEILALDNPPEVDLDTDTNTEPNSDPEDQEINSDNTTDDSQEPSNEDPEDTTNTTSDDSDSLINEEKDEINSEINNSGTNNSITITNENNQTDGDSDSLKESESSSVDYEGFYKEVMAPLKANGTTIQLKSPKEAIQLMQMGANYTKKMQAISQYKKTIMMLQNNNIDEDKLSFLIDLDKKNPEAIKKLLIDADINPYDIDTSEAPEYKQGNHKISDEEAAFTTTLEDLQQVQGGNETIRVINSWDQASKDVLWTNPEIMKIIHQQRESGVYNQIANEIERQKMLGQINPNMPFLMAYKTVGDALMQTKVQPKVVATKVAKPKPTISNREKAKAAFPTKINSNKTTKTFKNPLAMSDDEFLKQVGLY